MTSMDCSACFFKETFGAGTIDFRHGTDSVRAALALPSKRETVKFSFTWRIFNVFLLSEMNYAEKRLVIPTNRYFQLQSRREFGFM
jgi:hypothetical protein